MGAELVPADLEVLAERINRAHEECTNALRNSVYHALEAGRLLLEAKAGLPHGAWLPWLRENCAFPERTARMYMQLARELPARLEADKSATVTDLTVREAVDLLRRHSEPEPLHVFVREVVPPEPPEPVPVAVKSMPVEPLDPSTPLRVTVKPVDSAALRTMDLSPRPDPSALRSMDLSPRLTPPMSAKDVVVPEAVSRQEAGSVGEGERTRVISFGKELEGARDLTEVGLRLCRLGQQFLALQRDGWLVSAPPTGDLVVLVCQ